jgi:hypothetical protein
MIFISLFGSVLACAPQVDDPPVPVASSQAADCVPDPMPYLQAVDITDLDKNSVFSISPNSQYYVRACGKVSSMTLTLSTGAVFTNSPPDNHHDTGFPVPYTLGDIGTTYFEVTTDSSGHITGYVTPTDSCFGDQTQFNMNFIVPGSGGCESPPTRHYSCGFAMLGYNCNNGRNHMNITAPDMTSAIATCAGIHWASYPDHCYVIDIDGTMASDPGECTAGSGSWRSGNSCCNFKGSLSCPL